MAFGHFFGGKISLCNSTVFIDFEETCLLFFRDFELIADCDHSFDFIGTQEFLVT